jgi:hypothetical protein
VAPMAAEAGQNVFETPLKRSCAVRDTPVPAVSKRC